MFEKLIAPRSESQIIGHWKYKDIVYISVICPTFNQDSYIRDAIESFLAQETEYRFEVIIHDDASSDDTSEIVKDYCQRYPSIIKAVFQVENQYSINTLNPLRNLLEMATGKYIALCEGDDFWLHKEKLQKQIEIIESNASFSLITHETTKISESGDEILGCFNVRHGCYTTRDIIGNRWLFATNSLFFKKDVTKELPEWFLNSVNYDVALQLLASVHGDIYALPDNLSFYRVSAKGSLTILTSKRINSIRLKHFEMLFNFNRDNNYKFTVGLLFVSISLCKDIFKTKFKPFKDRLLGS
ncbi:glycosyltransferase family 2 protein [Shewanella chilikensis]|uniref:glycosyltransferase family 2 protein n=1 Tax=Shewanella chilikensis TaxID=558541 RepID=UPI003999EB91